MPGKYVHGVIDLISLGFPYLSVHEWKDKPAQEHGLYHRRFRHFYYQSNPWRQNYGGPVHASLLEKISQCPTPESRERLMAYISHDQIDRVWDEFSPQERFYWEAFFIWLLEHPSLLRDWAGVDVARGRIHRVIDGVAIWEETPGLTAEYCRLRAYARAVLKKRPELQEHLEKYGADPNESVPPLGVVR